MKATRVQWIQEIAKNWHDNALQLDFADWLDKNGDRDRANYIRLQLECSTAKLKSPSESLQANASADDFFEIHGAKWYEPLLEALGLNIDTIEVQCRSKWFRKLHDGATKRWLGGSSINLEIFPRSDSSIQRAGLTFEKGWISKIWITNPLALPHFRLSAALSLEPIHSVRFPLSSADHIKMWGRQSDPVLKQIRSLTLALDGLDLQHECAVATEILAEPFLSEVRDFTVLAGGFGMETLHPTLLKAISKNPITRNLKSVSISSLDANGLRAMLEDVRLEWSELYLDGQFNNGLSEHLCNARLNWHLETLMIRSFAADETLNDGGLKAICESSWPKLKRLDLVGQDITALSLKSLAESPFISQLEVLDLSNNRRLFIADSDLESLRLLSDQINPLCLKHLRLVQTGLTEVPEPLSKRFGDRVTI